MLERDELEEDDGASGHVTHREENRELEAVM